MTLKMVTIIVFVIIMVLFLVAMSNMIITFLARREEKQIEHEHIMDDFIKELNKRS